MCPSPPLEKEGSPLFTTTTTVSACSSTARGTLAPQRERHIHPFSSGGEQAITAARGCRAHIQSPVALRWAGTYQTFPCLASSRSPEKKLA